MKTTKTGQNRLVPIEPTLLPLLKAMHEECGGEGRVFPNMPKEEILSTELKRYLKLAGASRNSLT